MTLDTHTIVTVLFGGVLSVIGFFVKSTLSSMTRALEALQAETKQMSVSVNDDRTENKVVGARVIALEQRFNLFEQRIERLEHGVRSRR